MTLSIDVLPRHSLMTRHRRRQRVVGGIVIVSVGAARRASLLLTPLQVITCPCACAGTRAALRATQSFRQSAPAPSSRHVIYMYIGWHLAGVKHHRMLVHMHWRSSGSRQLPLVYT